jgi:hypothetical protein
MQECHTSLTGGANLCLGFLQITWFFSSLYLVNLYLTLFFTPIRLFSFGVFQNSSSRLRLFHKTSVLSLFSGVVGIASLSSFFIERATIST